MASRVYGHQKQRVMPNTSRRARELASVQPGQIQVVAAPANEPPSKAHRQPPASQKHGTEYAGVVGALVTATQDALTRLRTAIMDSFSELLFARPSFLEGMARLFDFGDTLSEYNSALTPEQADRLALASDWRAVGLDMWLAMDEFAAEHGDKRAS